MPHCGTGARHSSHRDNIAVHLLLGVLLLFPNAVPGADISIVPVWDGETVDCLGGENNRLSNRFGGNTLGGSGIVIAHTTSTVHAGKGGYVLQSAILAGEYGFAGLALSGFGPSSSYNDTRDLSGFTNIVLWIKNETGEAFTFVVEVKDYRDSHSHKARKSFLVSGATSWVQLTAPLPLTINNGWSISGSPDLSRLKLVTFVIEATGGAPVNGPVYVDDVAVVEAGGPLDSSTASADALLARIAHRQFRAMWGSRDRANGMLPINSSFADAVALNSTAGLVEALPRAITSGWVTRSEADAYISMVCTSLAQMIALEATLYGAGFVPPRYVDRVSLQAVFILEESPVDAALMFLALYQYKEAMLPSDPLRRQIETLLGRFNFAAFSAPCGWKLAFLPETGLFTTDCYDGYSTEIYTMSLAAHLALSNHVDITTHYFSGVNRTNAFLVQSSRAHLVHAMPEYRAPFVQWLFSMFVDTTGLGRDWYPNPVLSANPLNNARMYQAEVQAKLTQLNRGFLAQPDASDDGSCNSYEQFSLYNDFGRPEIMMPWSAVFSFLSDPAAAENSLRTILGNNLHGPLGFVDSARWPTGAAAPASFPARVDFWNIALSELALLEYLHGDSRSFAALPAVNSALVKVYPGTRLAIAAADHQAEIRFFAEYGTVYSVEFVNVVTATGAWQCVGSLNGTGAVAGVMHATAPAGPGFYRAIME